MDNVKSEKVIMTFASRTDLLKSINNNSGLKTKSLVKEDLSNENELDSLIPNPNFRRLVNSDGELIVGDSIYRINKKGTFYAHTKDIDELRRAVNADLSNVGYVSDNLKRIGNVFLYETFSSSPNEVINLDNTVKTKSILGNPDISKFPVMDVDRQTWAGKLIQNVFGTKKDVTVTLSSNNKRRLSASLYSYKYVVYSETGLTTKVEKKMWHGGWGKVVNWDSGTVIGWRNIIMKQKIEKYTPAFSYKPSPILIRNPYEPLAETIEFSKYPFSIGEGELFVCLPFIGEKTFSYENLQELGYKFAAGAFKDKFEGLARSKPGTTKVLGFSVDIPEEGVRYIYIANAERWGEGPSQTKVFNNSLDFVLSFGNQKDLIGYVAKSIADSQNLKNSELLSGEGYAYTQDGTGFAGMILNKIKR